jgi:hypothetical protein
MLLEGRLCVCLQYSTALLSEGLLGGCQQIREEWVYITAWYCRAGYVACDVVLAIFPSCAVAWMYVWHAEVSVVGAAGVWTAWAYYQA